MDFQAIIAGTVGKENTYGTVVGRVKAGAMSYARFSTDEFTGKIRGYVGQGEFTKDPLETFGEQASSAFQTCRSCCATLRNRLRASRRRQLLQYRQPRLRGSIALP